MMIVQNLSIAEIELNKLSKFRFLKRRKIKKQIEAYKEEFMKMNTITAIGSFLTFIYDISTIYLYIANHYESIDKFSKDNIVFEINETTYDFNAILKIVYVQTGKIAYQIDKQDSSSSNTINKLWEYDSRVLKQDMIDIIISISDTYLFQY